MSPENVGIVPQSGYDRFFKNYFHFIGRCMDSVLTASLNNQLKKETASLSVKRILND
jgi:hypothetical protein